MGTAVAIIYEPIQVAVTEAGQVWLEVHADAYRQGPESSARVRQLLAEAGAEALAASEVVDAALRRRAGRAVEIGAAVGLLVPPPTSLP